jgi:hypothetical protein
MLRNVFIIMLIVGTCSFVMAQDESKPGEFYLKIGAYSPDTALAFGAGFTQWFNSEYGIAVDVEFSTYDLTNEFLGSDEVLATYFNVPAHLNFIARSSMDSDMSLFYSAGATVAYRSADERYIWILEDEQEKTGFGFGFNGAVGLQYSHFFVEGRYIYYLTDTLDANDLQSYAISTMAGIRF